MLCSMRHSCNYASYASLNGGVGGCGDVRGWNGSGHCGSMVGRVVLNAPSGGLRRSTEF